MDVCRISSAFQLGVIFGSDSVDSREACIIGDSADGVQLFIDSGELCADSVEPEKDREDEWVEGEGDSGKKRGGERERGIWLSTRRYNIT